ncbi:Nitroreductase-like protein [Talaromyces proteolyticus]|uniref:Nitroreductase-like protein n=1 Tax=Talaromyces proteolyticus TaxID=1131652 RepID=A0AAD4KEC0_9EURO|nr:Nitroreductase-like protein [Talaromyces proteolyticus]KAH8689613.1 Nitroreductase-like protein [Talaromyces proteolyticus]
MSTPFLETVESRRSLYQLTNTSPIPDARIKEIVSLSLKHAPSAFNVQSARAVILLREQHEKLWDIGLKVVQEEMPPAAQAFLTKRVVGFRGAYGTVLWFEDEDAIDILKQKNPAIQRLLPEWSSHSSGIHQFINWTAFSKEGLGCNLQHYNFSAKFVESVHELWNVPRNWKLKGQLVFGQPVGGPDRVKEYKPIEGDRMLVFA